MIILVMVIAQSLFGSLNFSPTVAQVPNSDFVAIPANPSFRFAVDLNNKAPGESSPIESNYYLSKYLVTNYQYKQFLDSTNSKKYPNYWSNGNYPEGKGDHPVLSVSLYDAQNYCLWLQSLNPEWNFRLPTEPS